MTKEIYTRKGDVILVDDDDYERFKQYGWYLTANGYATANMRKEQNYKIKKLHRLIMGDPTGQQVDHINRNKLDNRKENLRVATPTQNRWNRGLARNNTSGYTGVHWIPWQKRWRAMIWSGGVNGKYTYLGSYKTPEEASEAYQRAAKERSGDFLPTDTM